MSGGGDGVQAVAGATVGADGRAGEGDQEEATVPPPTPPPPPPKSKLSKLTHLDLTGAAMGRRDRFPLLAACLEVCTRLNHLDLSCNDLGAESLNMLLSALLKNRKHRLEVLALGGNAIGGGGVGGAAIIASFIEFSTRAAANNKRTKLRRLDVRANALGDGGVRTIMLGLACSTITHLHLSENAIGDTAVPHLVAGLEKMRQITTLDLSFNNIGPVGGAALAACLAGKHPTLAHLDVSWNKLGNRGAVAFAGCLRKGTGALGELHLGSNDIGDAGGIAFVAAAAPAARGGLRVLRLDNNVFSSPVGRALLRAAAAASEAVGGRFRMGRLGSYGMDKHIGTSNVRSSTGSSTHADNDRYGNGNGDGGGGGCGGGASSSVVAPGGGAASDRGREKGNVGFAENWGFTS